MAENITGVAVYLLPGMKIEIRCPVTPKNGNGYFPRTEPLPQSVINGMSKPGELIKGFILEDMSIGSLSDSGLEGLSVIYTHNKTAENAIWFFSLTGERGLVTVISVPLHDHSSLVTGGPAYGTYFADEG